MTKRTAITRAEIKRAQFLGVVMSAAKQEGIDPARVKVEYLAPPNHPPAPTCLYRHFDRDGRLLYIGISLNAISRLAGHRDTAHWFYEIARVDIEQYASRREAEAAERKAIYEEKPLHNIAGAERAA